MGFVVFISFNLTSWWWDGVLFFFIIVVQKANIVVDLTYLTRWNIDTPADAASTRKFPFFIVKIKFNAFLSFSLTKATNIYIQKRYSFNA